jgi:hypothetical protein
MRLQTLCHLSLWFGLSAGVLAAPPSGEHVPVNNYPTMARVEYVNACTARNGEKLAAMYQCACAIDKIADSLPYDDFVEASTFARYQTLPGEGGGIFRDPDRGRQLAKKFRELEKSSLAACGMQT